MSWEGGVDLVAVTQAGLAMPNVIVHVARMAHTPVGSVPAGMVLWQPDPGALPVVTVFVPTDPKVAAYFGPNIFAGTPFEQAPALTGAIEVRTGAGTSGAKVSVGGHVFEMSLSELGALELIHRAPAAKKATLSVDGTPISIIVPPVGISGGPAAVWSPCGVYAR